MKLRGQVADDAKLDTLDITDHAEYSVRTQAVTIKATIKRTALQIDMRTGDYKPSRASVDVQLFTHGGVDQSSSAKSEQANSLADDYDKSFSKIVSQEIANYRSWRTRGRRPGPARSSHSTRPSDALEPLTKGQTGQMTGHVVANSDGGTARPGRWTVVGVENGTITPASAAGAAPAFPGPSRIPATASSSRATSRPPRRQASRAAPGSRRPRTSRSTAEPSAEYGATHTCRVSAAGDGNSSYSARLADIVGSDQPFPIIDTGGSAGGRRCGRLRRNRHRHLHARGMQRATRVLHQPVARVPVSFTEWCSSTPTPTPSA